MNESSTPETDALWYKNPEQHEVYKFARKLERQREAIRCELAEKDKQLEVMRFSLMGAQQGAEEARKIIRKRDEELEAMREAIKEAWIEIQYAEAGFAGLALRVCPNDSAVDSVLNRMTEALAKLKPFLA